MAVNIAPLSLAIIILITTTYTSWGVQLLKNNDCLDMCIGLEGTMQENHHLRWVAKKRTTALFIQQSKRWYDEERFNSHIHREKPQKMAKSFTPA